MSRKHFVERVQRQYNEEIAAKVIADRDNKAKKNATTQFNYLISVVDCKSKAVGLTKLEDGSFITMYERRKLVKAGIIESCKQRKVRKNKECRTARLSK